MPKASLTKSLHSVIEVAIANPASRLRAVFGSVRYQIANLSRVGKKTKLYVYGVRGRISNALAAQFVVF